MGVKMVYSHNTSGIHQKTEAATGRPATLLKKRFRHRCFPVNFEEFVRTPFLQNISRRLLPEEELHGLTIMITITNAW